MVFNSSTLGFEALARNLKCVSFDKRLNSLDTFKKYPKEGIFWMNPQNYKEFEKKINKILKIPKKKWIYGIKKYSKKFMTHDHKNNKTIKILKKLLEKD